MEMVLLVTFLLHAVCVNLLVGGLPVLLFTEWIAARGASGAYRELAVILAKVLPWVLVTAVLTGALALVFIQARDDPYFYGALRVLGYGWLPLILAVIVGYSGLQVMRSARDWFEEERSSLFWLLQVSVGGAVLVVLLLVVLVFVTVSVLAISPNQWVTIEQAGFWKAVRLPTVIPRYVHILLAAVAGTGLGVILYGVWLRRRGPRSDNRHEESSEQEAAGIMVTRYGAFWALVGIVPQMLVGPWLLWSLPEHVLAALVNGANPESWVFFFSLTSALLALVLLNATVVAPQFRWLAVGGVASLAVTFATMAMVRAHVHAHWLVKTAPATDLLPETRWSRVWLAVLFLVLGLGTVYLFMKGCLPTVPRGTGKGGKTPRPAV